MPLYIIYSGGRIVHSYGRLIPHEFPITDLSQISGPDGIGRINCTVSSGTATLSTDDDSPTGGVTQITDGATATLVVNPTDVVSFANRVNMYCNDRGSIFHLLLSGTSEFTNTVTSV